MRKQTDPPYKPFRKNLDSAGASGKKLEAEYREWCEAQGLPQALKQKYRS